MTQKQKMPMSLLALWLLIGLCAMGLGVLLMLDAGYFTVGYVEVDEIATAGFQVWGLPDLLVLVLIGLVVALGIVAVWTLALRKRISGFSVAGLSVLSVLLCILFLPMNSDFQVRYYPAPGQGYTVMRSDHASSLFVLQRKGKFVSYFQGVYQSSPVFYCTRNATLRIGAMRIDRGFYPSLDKDNQLSLLQQYCETE